MSLAWAQKSTPTTYNNKWRSVCYSPALDMYCAVGTQNSGSDAHRIMTSTDGGATWTAQSAPSSSYSFFGVCWANTGGGKFVAVGSANLIATSVDGVNWLAQTGPTGANSGNNTWVDVAWSDAFSVLVAINSRGTGTSPAASHNLMISVDGVSWTGKNCISDGSGGTTSGYGLGKVIDAPIPSISTYRMIVAGQIGGTRRLFTCIDPGSATTLQLRATDSSTGASSGTDELWLAWSPTLPLAACVFGRGDNPIYTSPDGTIWTQRNAPTTGPNRPIWKQLAWTGNQFVGVGLAGSTNTHQVIASPDGLTWTESSPGVGTVEPWNYLAVKSSTQIAAIASNANNDGLSAMVGTIIVPFISPTSGGMAGGTALTIHGDGSNGGFQAGALVYIDPQIHTFYPSLDPATDKLGPQVFLQATDVVVVDANTITCTTRIGVPRLSGVLVGSDVLVVNSSAATPNVVFYSIGAFTFREPVMVSMTPTDGPSSGGTSLTLTGTDLYVSNITGSPGAIRFVFSDASQVDASDLTFVNTTTLTCGSPPWVIDTAFIVDVLYNPPALEPGGEYPGFETPPSTTLSAAFTYGLTLDEAVAILKDECEAWFLPSYSIRLTSPSVYAALAHRYGFGTPIIIGLSPNDAATFTGAAVQTDPSLAAQAVWPQVFVHPDAPFVLGVPISLGVGGGTIAVSYATPFGRFDSVCWEWRATVELNFAYLEGEPSVDYIAPGSGTVPVPAGEIPDGGIYTGIGFSGSRRTTPCGCPSA